MEKYIYFKLFGNVVIRNAILNHIVKIHKVNFKVKCCKWSALTMDFICANRYWGVIKYIISKNDKQNCNIIATGTSLGLKSQIRFEGRPVALFCKYNNDLQLLLALKEKFAQAFNHFYELQFDTSCAAGSLEIVRYLFETRCNTQTGRVLPISNTALENAIQTGNLELVKYIHKEVKENIDINKQEIIQLAIQSGSVEVYDYVTCNTKEYQLYPIASHFNHYPKIITHTQLLKKVVETGCIEMIKRMQFVYNNSFDDLRVDLLDTAAENGHLHVIQFLDEQVKITEYQAAKCIIQAVKNGHIEVLRFIFTKYPEYDLVKTSIRTSNASINDGYGGNTFFTSLVEDLRNAINSLTLSKEECNGIVIPILELLKSNRISLSTCTIDSVALTGKVGLLEIVYAEKLALKEPILKVERKTLGILATKGYLDIIQYLWLNGLVEQRNLFMGLNFAVMSDKIDILTYIIKETKSFYESKLTLSTTDEDVRFAIKESFEQAAKTNNYQAMKLLHQHFEKSHSIYAIMQLASTYEPPYIIYWIENELKLPFYKKK